VGKISFWNERLNLRKGWASREITGVIHMVLIVEIIKENKIAKGENIVPKKG